LRKAREDDEIRLYCDIMVSRVKAWLASSQAKVRLGISVKFNALKSGGKVKELRASIANLKKTAKQVRACVRVRACACVCVRVRAL
jgi:hypothetical protein